ncbi:fimbrial protein [Proteus faecis]|uniref:fimbrial protein n=1 Tax=Proteus faecis TaxID=2050967 RepID=UPI0013A579DC|nr:fimbrial protein [Proteus faecis]
MKKSLFSLLILSTLSLSNQAIAKNSYLIQGNENISIQGNVIKRAPVCTLENIEPVVLDNIYDDEIEHSEAKEFKINFSNCTHSDEFKEFSIKLQRQESNALKNTLQGKDATNVLIQLLDEDDYPILLNQENNLTFKKGVVDGNAEFTLKANYKAPASGEIKAGQFASNLVFDAYINNDIIEDIE